jgi:broad specificity phosphatase PhoE
MTWTNTLYLVRHGENPANLTGEFSYKLVDYALTPKGVLQAEQTAAFFTAGMLDAVYASPLKRARETAEIIARPQSLQVLLKEELREVNVGELELTPPDEAAWRLHDSVIRAWVQGQVSTRFPAGENFVELVERAQRGLLEITRGRSGQRILIAAHGGILSAIVRAFCTHTHDLLHAGMQNCAISEIELTTCAQKILTGTLRTWGCVTHLSGEAAAQAMGIVPAEPISLRSSLSLDICT